jgi:hypothetical protein
VTKLRIKWAVYVACMEKSRSDTKFWFKNWNRWDHLGDLGVNRNSILK